MVGQEPTTFENESNVESLMTWYETQLCKTLDPSQQNVALKLLSGNMILIEGSKKSEA